LAANHLSARRASPTHILFSREPNHPFRRHGNPPTLLSSPIKEDANAIQTNFENNPAGISSAAARKSHETLSAAEGPAGSAKLSEELTSRSFSSNRGALNSKITGKATEFTAAASAAAFLAILFARNFFFVAHY
jgi:hypothetical protein